MLTYTIVIQRYFQPLRYYQLLSKKKKKLVKNCDDFNVRLKIITHKYKNTEWDKK